MILILLAFAAYRITRLITKDDIASPVRDKWASWFPSSAKWAMMIACPYCVGMYVSAILTILTVIALEPFREWWALWLLWPGVAGAQSLLSAIDERLNKD